MPGPILNRAILFTQWLLKDVHFSKAGSTAEDRAFTKLTMAYQVVFRKSLKDEVGWKTSAGWPAAMTARLIKAEAGDFTGL